MLGHDKHDPEKYDSTGEDHCFVAGTLITTKRGDIPIEEVTTDDFVLTRKGFRKVLFAGLTKKNADVMTVKFSNGKSLTGTPNHPIFVHGRAGFVDLDDLCIGDFVNSLSEDWLSVIVIKMEFAGKADVYNLTVDEEHEYFANGFLVHNCTDAVVYGCLSRPFTPMKKIKRDKYDIWKDKPKEKSVWTY